MKPLTEVAVELNPGRRARRRGVVAPRATVSRVTGASVEIGEASRLAADWEARAIERAFEGCRAVGSEVDGAFSDRASLCGVDPHRQVGSVDKGYCVTRDRELRSSTLEKEAGANHHRSRWYRQR